MKTLICPYCGCSLVRLGISKDKAATYSYHGTEHHFCCQDCADCRSWVTYEWARLHHLSLSGTALADAASIEIRLARSPKSNAGWIVAAMYVMRAPVMRYAGKRLNPQRRSRVLGDSVT